VALAIETAVALQVTEDDLYPADEKEQKLLAVAVQKRFQAAERARQPYEVTWLRYYKAFRSYRKMRKPGQWKSNVWMPITFTVIETILPRVCAAIPSAKVNPIGPEDVEAGETLEEALKWAEDKSDLYPEQVKGVLSALLYGTGVLKTGVIERFGANIVQEPLLEETSQQVATGEQDIDGNPLMMTQQAQTQVIDPTTGQPQMTFTRQEYLEYRGPHAECVDIENFFPDPLGDDVQTCRWVIHRVYRDRAHMEDLFAKKVYRLPDYADAENWDRKVEGAITYAAVKRLNEIELGGQEVDQDQPKDLFPVLEMWRKGAKGAVEVVTVAGERGEGVLLRAQRSPYAHNLLPFIRIVDHLVPHEFWGIGEVEPIEGIQDALNQIWNARLDNIKLTLNQMFAVVIDYLENPSDLIVRPGGIVRMKEGLPLNQVFDRIDLGDVTGNAYTEAQELERESEKTSGVSPYQTGQDSPAYNRTATGVALISEQGNTRFSFKTKLAEATGYKTLVRMYASLLQQYVPDDLMLRIKSGEAEMKQQMAMQMAQQQFQMMIQQGADPAMAQQQAMAMIPQIDPMDGWKAVTQDSIMGRFDFDIVAESSAQTESMRREQTLSLAGQMMQDPYMKPRPIREDLLREFGRKNVDDYLYSDMEISMMQQSAAAAQASQSAPEQGGQSPAA
jgi:hypothetical protein